MFKFKARSQRKLHRIRGFSMLETAMAMIIMAVIIGSIAVMMADNAAQMRAKGAADKVLQVHEAAKGYITANQGALLASTAGGPQVILAGRQTNGAAVPEGSLQAEGFLPPGYVDTNGFGQRHALIIRQPSAGRLDAMVTTYGGREIPESHLGRVANFIGAAGGYVSETNINAGDANQVVGTYGGWRTPIASWGPVDTRPSAGHVQATLAFENGDLLADYVYRHDVGIESANTMYTDLHMDNNNLIDVDTIYGTETGGVRNLTVEGNVRATIDVWARDVQASRNVVAQENVAAGGSVTAGVDVIAARDVRAGRNLAVGNNASINNNLAVGGDATIDHNLTVLQKITADDVDARHINADTIVYGYGNLTKEKGVRLGDLLPKMVPQYSYIVTDGFMIPKPVCANGGAPRVMVLRQQESAVVNMQINIADGNTSSFGGFIDNIAAYSSGNWWRIKWEGSHPMTGGPRVAVAQTYCSYVDNAAF